MTRIDRKNVHLVCGGKHVFDYVRLELLKLLADLQHVRLTVASDYSRQDQMHTSEAMITYNSDLIPDESEQDGLQHTVRKSRSHPLVKWHEAVQDRRGILWALQELR